jgi:hypothetical protein
MTAFFQDPRRQSLAVATLLAPGGGHGERGEHWHDASGDHSTLKPQPGQGAAARGKTLGEATRDGLDTTIDPDVQSTFVLLGIRAPAPWRGSARGGAEGGRGMQQRRSGTADSPCSRCSQRGRCGCVELGSTPNAESRPTRLADEAASRTGVGHRRIGAISRRPCAYRRAPRRCSRSSLPRPVRERLQQCGHRICKWKSIHVFASPPAAVHDRARAAPPLLARGVATAGRSAGSSVLATLLIAPARLATSII